MKQNYILLFVFSLFFFKGNAQSNYSVTPIPFQPFSGTLASLTTMDDLYSESIQLPFSFDFYGVTYSSVRISTNGYIYFGTPAGNNSPWQISYPIPNTSFAVKNSILGCYEDLYNNTGTGSLTYGSYGTAPYRKFVVYFNNQPHFSCGINAISSFQMILSETTNVIDVQLIQRASCTSWNSGNGVVGLINLDGTQAITPPGRNTGNWTATQEAWRFYRPGYFANYSFVRCDDDTDGLQTFDLSVATADIFGDAQVPIVFYHSLADAQTGTNPIVSSSYINVSNPETLYVAGNGLIKAVNLSVIDCAVDADNDGVSTDLEDINTDTNLANDDTDFDGLPNYNDNDDDGDLILTNVEYVFNRNQTTSNPTTVLDSDSDGIPNYLDNDDDGDSVLTFLEDYNHDGNPANDDTNANGTPDFLENAVALGVHAIAVRGESVKVFPNPATTVLNIQNMTTDSIKTIDIYSVNGTLVKSIKPAESLTSISVADLQSGVYFVKVNMSQQVENYKFVKN